MKVLITGTSQGIGKAIANKFLEACIDNIVYGIDVQTATIKHERYHHFIADVSKKTQLPDFDFNFEIIINNAGIQNGGTGQYPIMDDIDVNLRGTIYVTEKYAFQPQIKSVLNIGSASGHTGAEFPEYSASKGGVFDSILEKNLNNPNTELTFKPSPSIKKDNAFLNYISARKIERKMDKFSCFWQY